MFYLLRYFLFFHCLYILLLLRSICGAIQTSLRASDLPTIQSTGIRSIRSIDLFIGHPTYNWQNWKIDRLTQFCRSVVLFWPIFLCKFAKIVMRPIFFDFLVFKMAQMVMSYISIVSKMAQLVMPSIFSSSPFFQF